MRVLTLFFLFVSTVAAQSPEWKDSILVNVSVLNEWCRHCPDWNQTRYSLQAEDGMVYVAQAHKSLNVAVHSHYKFRMETDGRIGAYVHVLDESGKDFKLRIVQKIAKPTD
jgi:hypothetical protein